MNHSGHKTDRQLNEAAEQYGDQDHVHYPENDRNWVAVEAFKAGGKFVLDKRKEIYQEFYEMIDRPLRQVSNPDGAGVFLIDRLEKIQDVLQARIKALEEDE